MFSILEASSSELQLAVREVLFITKYQPTLCKQKEFYNILLFNSTDYTATKPDFIQEKLQKKCTNISSKHFLLFSPLRFFIFPLSSTTLIYSSLLLLVSVFL